MHTFRSCFHDHDIDSDLLPFVSRITFDDHPDVAQAGTWIECPQDLLAWLRDHPGSTAFVSRWGLTITTPNCEDLLGLSRFDCPSGVCCGVEGWGTSKVKDGFAADWCFG